MVSLLANPPLGNLVTNLPIDQTPLYIALTKYAIQKLIYDILNQLPSPNPCRQGSVQKIL